MLTALLALSPARKLIAGLTGAAVLMAAGAGAAIAIEHRAPWGLETKRAKLEKAIENPVDGWRLQVRSMTASRDEWRDAEKRCAAARRKDNTDAASAVTTASDDKVRANGSAFNQGYAAGRAVGLQQCGARREEANPVGDGREPRPGVVRDDATDLAASFGQSAYVPRNPLPADR